MAAQQPTNSKSVQLEEVEDEDDIQQEQFIHPNDVEIEVPTEGDAPMDEDNEDDLPTSGEPSASEEDTSIQQFQSHSSSIFTISTHPSAPLAISGGEDDTAYIWNMATGEEIVKLTGHSDSVSAVGWSFDGEMVASGGMDGKVRVWRRVGKTGWRLWEFVTEVQGPDEVMWLKWHPKGNVLLAGSNDGTVWLWQMPSGNTMQVFSGHEGSVNCGDFTSDGKRILTADNAGTLILFSPRSPTPQWKMTPFSPRFGMKNGITSLSPNSSGTIAVIGGADGEVRVVNLAKGEVIGVLEGHESGESVEAVAFVDWGAGAGGVVVTGATDGKVCVWDVTLMKLRHTLTHSDAITSLNPSPATRSHHITSSSSDKTLKTWDTRTGTLLAEHKGHEGPVLAAAVGAFEESVVGVSAGDDGVCLVFDLKL